MVHYGGSVCTHQSQISLLCSGQFQVGERELCSYSHLKGLWGAWLGLWGALPGGTTPVAAGVMTTQW